MSAAETVKPDGATPKPAEKPTSDGPSTQSPSGTPRGGRGGGGPMRGQANNRGGNQGARGRGSPYARGGRGAQGNRGGGRGGSNQSNANNFGNNSRGSADRSFGGGSERGRFDRVLDKLNSIQGPTLELPPLDSAEKKFSGRARIYIGNFSNELSEEQLKEIVSTIGEVGEMFFNREKNFAFVRMGSRFEAEKVKRELDGQMKNGRPLKVRFSPHQAAVKVTNLGPWVSNELLHRAFSIFGEIERCIVFVDERGRSRGEGIVEFEKKPFALECVKRCSDGCFFLTSSLRPVIAEIKDEAEDDDGMQEKMLHKRNHEFQAERETGPRFAAPGSFEFEYGAKWKALYDMKKQKMEALEREMKLEEDKLIAQMEFARYEHETEALREQLRQREASREQHKNQWEERERQMQDMLKNEQERRNRDEQAMVQRLEQQDQSMRRRQEENSLFMQAQELNQMLDQQEAAMGGPGPRGGPINAPWGPGGNNFGGPGGPGGRNMNNGPFGNSFGDEDFGGFGGGNQGFGNGFGAGGPRGGRGGGHPWGAERGGHQNKRRRF